MVISTARHVNLQTR